MCNLCLHFYWRMMNLKSCFLIVVTWYNLKISLHFTWWENIKYYYQNSVKVLWFLVLLTLYCQLLRVFHFGLHLIHVNFECSFFDDRLCTTTNEFISIKRELLKLRFKRQDLNKTVQKKPILCHLITDNRIKK